MTAEDDNALALMRLSWRADAIDEWRKEVGKRIGRVETRVDSCEEGISAMTNESRIAKAVATELSRERKGRDVALSLTWYQKAGAVIAGALVLADAVRGLVS